MPEDLKVGDIVRWKTERELYLVLKLARSGWRSSPYVTVREYDPRKIFVDKIKIHEFFKSALTRDLFQTQLMQAQLRSWFNRDIYKQGEEDAE